ncbi:helix-turn-helix domain-containing protein [Carnobacterium maltaromaticum]|uniref:helix-turn-helix domain-containing protein n=1 Tax=Carnobacterium maltaromaticum TaxID=2751 RepID=UPI0039AEEAEC
MELDSLLSTSTLREITLIKLLNQRYPNWISKEEISSQLYISNRTLKSTVIVINSFFKEKNYEQYIETDAAFGYKLSASTNAISNLIYLERLKSSTSFNLLLSIYNKKFISSKHFTDYYFISLTSFYKDVRTINLILDKFGIQFNSREGTLSGGIFSNPLFFL